MIVEIHLDAEKPLFVRVPKDTYRAIKQTALDRDMTMRQLVMDWGRQLETADQLAADRSVQPSEPPDEAA